MGLKPLLHSSTPVTLPVLFTDCACIVLYCIVLYCIVLYFHPSPITLPSRSLSQIGDHAVFGSRSSIVCSGATDRIPVKIKAGAMLADRCSMQAGAVLGRNAVMVRVVGGRYWG